MEGTESTRAFADERGFSRGKRTLPFLQVNGNVFIILNQSADKGKPVSIPAAEKGTIVNDIARLYYKRADAPEIIREGSIHFMSRRDLSFS